MSNTPFSENLDRSLEYIRGFSTSYVLQALVSAGTLDRMKQAFTIRGLSKEQSYQEDLFEAIVRFLVTEEIVEAGPDPDTYKLTDFGVWIAEQPGWFNLLVGGYQNVFANLDTILRDGSAAAKRDSHFVGLGSYEISLHDAFPIVWKLIDEVNPDATRFVDIGCGDGYFVREICSRLPLATAIGVEPSVSARNAVQAVKSAGLDDRISIVQEDGLASPVAADTDFVLFAFVLQEILPQTGEAGLIDYFVKLRESGFAGCVLIIEVDYAPDDQSVMRTPIGRGYYNPYYLLHPLTDQKLMPIGFWRELFAKAGYDLVAERTVDPNVDPSGLELGLVFSPANNG